MATDKTKFLVRTNATNKNCDILIFQTVITAKHLNALKVRVN